MVVKKYVKTKKKSKKNILHGGGPKGAKIVKSAKSFATSFMPKMMPSMGAVVGKGGPGKVLGAVTAMGAKGVSGKILGMASALGGPKISAAATAMGTKGVSGKILGLTAAFGGPKISAAATAMGAKGVSGKILALGSAIGGPKISGALGAASAFAGGPGKMTGVAGITSALGAASALSGGPGKMLGSMGPMGMSGPGSGMVKAGLVAGKTSALLAPETAIKTMLGAPGLAAVKTGVSVAQKLGFQGASVREVAKGVVGGPQVAVQKALQIAATHKSLSPEMSKTLKKTAKIAKKSPEEALIAVTAMLKGSMLKSFSLPKSIKSVSGAAAATSQIKNLLAAAKSQ